MRNFLQFALIGVIIFSVIYCGYWIAKSVSYKLWYEDLVKQTVKEMVQEEYLTKKDSK